MKTPDRTPIQRLAALLSGRWERAASPFSRLSLFFVPFAFFRAFRSSSRLSLFFVPFVILFCISPLHATDPCLARLSFWVPPERMAEFEAVYNEMVVPILKTHGLMESSERGRTTADSVFARLFEVKAPSDFSEKWKALRGDPAWRKVNQDLGTAFGTTRPDGSIRGYFRIYAAPAQPGKAVSAGYGRGHWRGYDVMDGLASARVSSILQDREGHVWFGTNGGVSRYDGQTFATFTIRDGLVHNYVNSIIQDREGDLWFGTWGGVSRYDGQTFTTFTEEDGLVHNYVNSIIQDREGDLWFGTNGGGVSRYDGKAFTTFTQKDGLASNYVVSIFQDREGHLWFGGYHSGVSRYDGQTFTKFTRKDGLADNFVMSIFQDRKGHLWFGTWGGGVSRYDGKIFTNFTIRDGLVDDRVLSVLQEQDGDLWFGTRRGVSRYDGKSFTNFTTTDGLVHNDVRSIFQDPEGHVWFGTWGGGVSRYDGETFTTFTTEDGLAYNEVCSMFLDRDENLWFGTTGGGVSRYDGKTFTNFASEDGFPHDWVSSAFQDREGDLWFGTYGVIRYDGKTFTHFASEDGLVHHNVRTIFQDREGDLWFGTARGLSRYDGKIFTNFTTRDGLAHDDVQSIFQDREGDLWFGTAAGGVSRYDGKTFITFTTEDGLGGNRVRSVFQDREGDLWFGTSGGVSRYDGKTFTTFTTEDGLAHDNVRSVLQDREGDLWFGTGGGVSRYDGKTFQTLTSRDGVAGIGVSALLQDRQGHFWFGTQKGVTRYCQPAPSSPSVFIDAVIADRRYEGISELAIPSTSGFLAFEFRGMNFKTRPEAMVYRYRLVGYDEGWRNTHARHVEYQDLPRGTYTFEVQAVDRDLVYSESPAVVNLKVHLPYERIAWISVLSIAVLLIAWQTVRVVLRDRRLRASNAALSEANRELFGLNDQLRQRTGDLQRANREVRQANQAKSAFLANMSHELRTPLNSVIAMSDILLEKYFGALTDQQEDYVKDVRESGQHLLSLINDILDLSKVEAGHSPLELSEVDMKPLLEGSLTIVRERALNHNIELSCDVPDGLPQIVADERKLKQVVFNLLSNGVKFTPDGGRVGIEAVVEGEGVQVCVWDTGIGIAEADREKVFEQFEQVEMSPTRTYEGTGLGLALVKRFVEQHGGRVWLESEVGQGSRFYFSLPFEPSEG